MLTSQLRELENINLVNRKVYAQVPPKVEYSLTKKGFTLEAVLFNMHDWGKALLVSTPGLKLIEKSKEEKSTLKAP